MPSPLLSNVAGAFSLPNISESLLPPPPSSRPSFLVAAQARRARRAPERPVRAGLGAGAATMTVPRLPVNHGADDVGQTLDTLYGKQAVLRDEWVAQIFSDQARLQSKANRIQKFEALKDPEYWTRQSKGCAADVQIYQQLMRECQQYADKIQKNQDLVTQHLHLIREINRLEHKEINTIQHVIAVLRQPTDSAQTPPFAEQLTKLAQGLQAWEDAYFPLMSQILQRDMQELALFPRQAAYQYDEAELLSQSLIAEWEFNDLLQQCETITVAHPLPTVAAPPASSAQARSQAQIIELFKKPQACKQAFMKLDAQFIKLAEQRREVNTAQRTLRVQFFTMQKQLAVLNDQKKELQKKYHVITSFFPGLLTASGAVTVSEPITTTRKNTRANRQARARSLEKNIKIAAVTQPVAGACHPVEQEIDAWCQALKNQVKNPNVASVALTAPTTSEPAAQDLQSPFQHVAQQIQALWAQSIKLKDHINGPLYKSKKALYQEREATKKKFEARIQTQQRYEDLSAQLSNQNQAYLAVVQQEEKLKFQRLLVQYKIHSLRLKDARLLQHTLQRVDTLAQAAPEATGQKQLQAWHQRYAALVWETVQHDRRTLQHARQRLAWHAEEASLMQQEVALYQRQKKLRHHSMQLAASREMQIINPMIRLASPPIAQKMAVRMGMREQDYQQFQTIALQVQVDGWQPALSYANLASLTHPTNLSAHLSPPELKAFQARLYAYRADLNLYMQMRACYQQKLETLKQQETTLTSQAYKQDAQAWNIRQDLVTVATQKVAIKQALGLSAL